ncbi:MAG: hypothetical protein Q8N34_03320 [Gammaproteobacteria bacterium]|nr:hypothetical protein [Gammaproteobacteria bacterium]
MKVFLQVSGKTMHSDAEIIDSLGGPSALASLFKIKSPSVSEWKQTGIPDARRQTLALLYPDICPAGWAPQVEPVQPEQEQTQ